MLDALCDPEYLAIKTPGWEGILKHGVYHTKKELVLRRISNVGRVLRRVLTKVVCNPA